MYKTGRTIVAGILNHTDKIDIIASVGQPVDCYDSRESRIESKIFNGFPAFSLPRPQRNVTFYLDDDEPISDVGIMFLFDDVPMGFATFLQSATIVGTEPLLREALKGHKYIPRAYWRDLAAVELQTNDPSN